MRSLSNDIGELAAKLVMYVLIIASICVYHHLKAIRTIQNH